MDGAVVVLYNPKAKELRNILDYSGIVDITFIIDNSPENHLREINEIISVDNESVVYEHHPENIGLCKGMNYGIRFLKSKGCSWVLTMNSDSHFKNDILGIFRSYVLSNDCKDVALLAPQYDYDRKKAKPSKENREIKWAMMSGNYINTSIFHTVGGFKEEFFVDGLDIEYCLHAKSMGYKIIECSEAVLEHMPAETREIRIFGKSILKYGIASPQRYYYQAKSFAWICKRYNDPTIVVLCVYKYLKILLLFNNKREYLRAYHKGIKEGLKMK